jgi:sterol desaturase/sphingolipid hydroxylase (fatty acid hydroxylase superfamily)
MKISSIVLRPYFELQLICCLIEIFYPLFSYNNYNTLSIHFLCGCGLWNITEYMYHRFLQHTYFYASHKNHHSFPTKEKYIHLSFVLTQGFTPAIVYILYNRIGIFSGFIFSGLLFEMSHFISHNYLSNTITKLTFKETKRYHNLHHKNEKCNFGFLTPSYDYMFNTIDPESRYNYLYLVSGLFFPVLLFIPIIQNKKLI